MLGCKAIDNPIEKNKKLQESGESPLVDKGMYHQLLDRLIYLLHTRPNTSAVQQKTVCSFLLSDNIFIEKLGGHCTSTT